MGIKYREPLERYPHKTYQQCQYNVNEEEKLYYLRAHTYEIEHGSIDVNNMIIQYIRRTL